MNPVCTSFGSAPASTSAIASSKWPFCTASSNGVVPLPAGLDELLSTGPSGAFSRRCSGSLTLIPASRNARTTSMCPSRTAKKNGVNPESSVTVDVGAGLDERPDDGCVPFGCRPHQRGLSAPLTRVVVRATHQQRFHRFDVSRNARPS